MDSTTIAGIIGASAALAGVFLTGVFTYAVERRRGREASREAHRQELRSACSDFTSAIARVRSKSYALKDDPAARSSLLSALDDARVDCERLRLLVSEKGTQEAARLSLRHAYAVWKLAETGVDPRSAEYPGRSPHKRLRDELTRLYVGVRTELNVPQPEDVFAELDD